MPKQQEQELTITQAGQVIGRSPAQVTRLITLGELRAHRDTRGWWRVEAESARNFLMRLGREPAPAA